MNKTQPPACMYVKRVVEPSETYAKALKAINVCICLPHGSFSGYTCVVMAILHVIREVGGCSIIAPTSRATSTPAAVADAIDEQIAIGASGTSARSRVTSMKGQCFLQGCYTHVSARSIRSGFQTFGYTTYRLW